MIVVGDLGAGARAAGLGNRLVAADVVAVHVCADHVADRPVADGADRVQDLGAERRELRVHHHDAFVAGEHRGVPAGADEHVDVVAHLDGVDDDLVEVLLLLRDGASRHGQRRAGNHCGRHQHQCPLAPPGAGR